MNFDEDQPNTLPLASGAKVQTLRAPMAWKRKLSGSVLSVIGFILSPLSWWNDAVVNLPLALLFAWFIGIFYKPAAEKNSTTFDAMVILGYWLTNILGFVLMHKGVKQVVSNKDSKYSWRSFAKDIAISLIYTVLIVILIKLGILQPIKDYFTKK